LTCSSILSYRAFVSRTEIIPLSGEEYTEGMVGEPKYLNPILSQTNKVDAAICSLIFSGLTKLGAKREVIPDLAEKWEQSPDGKVYTFYLRKDVFWHDGKPLIADDVIFTIAAINDPDYCGTLAKLWRDVKVDKIDNYTVKFTLKSFCAGFLNNTTVGILPRHILGGIPAKNLTLHTFNLNPIGTGIYCFETLKLDSFGKVRSVVLKRDENYYLSKPYIDRVIFNFYSDDFHLFEAYKEKEIAAIDSIQPEQVADVCKWKNFNLYKASLPEYTALFFNTKKSWLDNKEVRQALAFSTNKTEIIKKALFNEACLIDSPILPDFFGYNPDILKYKFDSVKAKSILEKTGFKEDKDGIRKKDGKELEFNLVTVDTELNRKIAELVQNQWKKIGVSLKIKVIDASVLQRDYIRPRNYDILLFGESLGADPDVFPYWHSSEIDDPGLNLSCYVNKEADRCLEDARQTADSNIRQQKYIDFQNMIAEDMPAIFLFSPYYIYGVSNKIKGIEINYIISPADRFSNISKWYINYKRKRK